MGIWEMIVGILVLILSIIMVIVIILQEGHQAGLGTVTGGADSFLSKGKARTADAIFAKITKYCAITFFILVVVLNALSFFGIAGDNIDNSADTESSVVSEVSNIESSVADESKDESSSDASAEDSGEAKESGTEASDTEASQESVNSEEAVSDSE